MKDNGEHVPSVVSSFRSLPPGFPSGARFPLKAGGWRLAAPSAGETGEQLTRETALAASRSHPPPRPPTSRGIDQ